MIIEKPCVFAVSKTYQIMVWTEQNSIIYVKLGNKTYYDESNGILKSCNKVHRITVPAKELNLAKKYAVCEREIIERKPYFPEIKDTVETEIEFVPVKSASPRAYHIADAHNLCEEPIKAAKSFGKIDFLILNGDIPDFSHQIEQFLVIYRIAGAITKGSIPIVFARGNHDLRGKHAENFAEYTPTYNGNSYYTFRLGNIWGLILDCGEDKNDDFDEYNGTICCHDFRQKQTQFIKDIIKNKNEEYLKQGVKTKIVICHIPFSLKYKSPFDIEQDIYGEWTRLLNRYIKPDIFISAHIHKMCVIKAGDEMDRLGLRTPVITASDVDINKKYFSGAGFIFSGGKNFRVVKTDSNEKKGKIKI